ncbi:hypothetical protein [Xylocopilactobacillus apicola]|uniref:Pre-toxin TG domain-containing protein n=1 Tax=Xylocopilactobacillus apicola TaxID=2932184 RepID=A0AAU9DAB8_9LACO|nr:hypothetical protein [Xylocopilactobacillus apicola]BDR59330.1 hypothetical protein XA3_17710 [Xylocopilactobacillus apicola]
MGRAFRIRPSSEKKRRREELLNPTSGAECWRVGTQISAGVESVAWFAQKSGLMTIGSVAGLRYAGKGVKLSKGKIGHAKIGEISGAKPINGKAAKGVDQVDFGNLKNSSSVIEKAKIDPLYHDFPAALNQDILSNPIVYRSDGRIEYLAKGSIDGINGVYHITVKNNTIIHRTFIPKIDWKRFSELYDLPDFKNIPLLGRGEIK